ncbi:hypothetical protein WJX74_006669 [Apatococcus lobatus]|uniref:Apple domain-containing protein n=1 Tax=Apatococcus lobatus TaxID=904363 RepID=A0AAW1R132_9CHLO
MSAVVVGLLIITILGIIGAVAWALGHKGSTGTGTTASTTATTKTEPSVSQAQKDAALAKAKANAAASLAAAAAAKATTSPSSASAPATGATYTPIFNWDASGNDIGSYNVTKDECQQKCNTTQGCAYFQTDFGGSECWLKGAGTPQWKYDEDKTTYVTDSVMKSAQLPYDRHPGFDTAGKDIGKSIASPDACGVACAADQACEFFVTDADGSCWLRSGAKDVTVSANRSTYVRPGGNFKGTTYTPYYGWDAGSSGGDVGQQTSNTPGACGQLCMNTNGCAFYVTDAAGSLCWLKASGTPSPSANSDRVAWVPDSTAKSWGGVQLPYEKHEGLDTSGSDVGQIDAGPGACSAACAANKACGFYVTDSAGTKCWLKSGQGAAKVAADRNTYIVPGTQQHPDPRGIQGHRLEKRWLWG